MKLGLSLEAQTVFTLTYFDFFLSITLHFPCVISAYSFGLSSQIPRTNSFPKIPNNLNHSPHYLSIQFSFPSEFLQHPKLRSNPLNQADLLIFPLILVVCHNPFSWAENFLNCLSSFTSQSPEMPHFLLANFLILLRQWQRHSLSILKANIHFFLYLYPWNEFPIFSHSFP